VEFTDRDDLDFDRCDLGHFGDSPFVGICCPKCEGKNSALPSLGHPCNRRSSAGYKCENGRHDRFHGRRKRSQLEQSTRLAHPRAGSVRVCQTDIGGAGPLPRSGVRPKRDDLGPRNRVGVVSRIAQGRQR